MSDVDMPLWDPVPGPYSFDLLCPGQYRVLFEGKDFGDFFMARTLRMEATLIRDVVDGLNAGYARRHPIETGAGDAGDRKASEAGQLPTEPSVSTSPAPAAQPPLTYDTIPEVRAWIAEHPTRTHSNGIALAQAAYLDEVDQRPAADADGRSAA